MLREAVFHRPKLNWSFACDEKTVCVRIRTKRGDVREVRLAAGDKYAWERTVAHVPMKVFASDDRFDYWEAEVQPLYRRLAYYFRLIGGGEEICLTEKGFCDNVVMPAGLFEYPYLNPADVFRPPEWVKSAVFYQIFPERFANGDPSNDPEGTERWGGKPERGNFFGGDLQGVIDRLDYLSELGITAIYFTPVFAATTNHKYDTRDYLKVDPHFGTNDTLKRLVEACHRKGIRVLLDAVFNHCGRTFAPFLDVLERGERSPYAGWFHVREYPLRVVDGVPTYETFAFEPIMPKLNTEHPEVQEYLLNAARYWIEEVGIDGWRLDVANEVDHRFWRRFRETVKAAKPDAYILGEIWHDAMMWLQGDQFDAVMNYPFTNAVLDFFTSGTLDAAGFAGAVGSQLAGYPRQASEAAFNLLDSHDTPRLLTRCGGNKARMKLAALFQLAFPGVPCIYYGDEIGMTGGEDPDCRKCMEWDPAKQDRELFETYRRWIAMRKEHPAWRSTNVRFLRADRGEAVLATERWDGERDRWVFVFNAGAEAREVPVRLPAGVWKEAETGEAFAADGRERQIPVGGLGYRMLRQQA